MDYARLAGVTDEAGRDELELTKALGQVGFELGMMASASVRLAQTRLGEDGLALNVYLESSHLHARLLIDFFVRKISDRFPTDIRRTDFAPDWTPAPVDAAERLNNNYWLLHKYLAHLTWERVSKDTPKWNYPDIAVDVVDVAAAWSEHLAAADQSLGEIFLPYVDLARLRLTGGT